MTLIRAILFSLSMLVTFAATAQDANGIKYVSPAAYGGCWKRETAESFARQAITNQASAMCRALPGTWLLKRNAITSESYGYLQCFPDKCSTKGEVNCYYERSRMPCENLEKKKPEKHKDAESEAGKAKEQKDKDGKDGSPQKKDMTGGNPADANQKAGPKKDDKSGTNDSGKAKPTEQSNKGKEPPGGKKDTGKAGPADGTQKPYVDARVRDEARQSGPDNKYKAACDRMNLSGSSVNTRPGEFVCGPGKRSGDAPAENNASKNLWDELDETAADGQIKAKHEQLVQDYRNKAERQCISEWSRIQACYKTTGCRVPGAEETKQCIKTKCGNEPSRKLSGKCLRYEKMEVPKDAKPNTVYYDLFRKCEEYAEGQPNPKFPPWEQCSRSASECHVDRVCFQNCNPSGYSDINACVRMKMYQAPSVDAAKAQVRQEWKRKETQPQKSAGPRNFLD